MQVTLRVFGLELIYLHASTDEEPAAEPEPEPDAALSGGYLGSAVIDAGNTDRYLGFTNGREDDE